jgi:hypothetical protein
MRPNRITKSEWNDRVATSRVKTQKGPYDNLQVRKADPVPASTLKATQRKSGDRVRLPDCEMTKFEEVDLQLSGLEAGSEDRVRLRNCEMTKFEVLKLLDSHGKNNMACLKI